MLLVVLEIHIFHGYQINYSVKMFLHCPNANYISRPPLDLHHRFDDQKA